MLRTIFAFTILGIGIFAAFFSRFAALLLYLWFALFRPQEFLWFSTRSWRLSLILGMLLVVPCLLKGIFPNFTRPLSFASILFLINAFLIQLVALNPEVGWEWLDYIAKLIVVSLLSVTLITDQITLKANQRRFLLVVAVIAGCFGYYSGKAGLVYLLRGGVRFASGLAGSFRDNNGYALGIAMILPLLIVAYQNLSPKNFMEGWIRRGFLAIFLLSPLAIIGTFSRGGFLALLAVCLTLIFLQKQRMKLLAAFAIIFAILILVIPIPSEYLARIGTIGSYEEVQDDSALSRLHFWRVAINMVCAHPLGIGLNGYKDAYDSYDFLEGQFGTRREVHSSHFELLAETGFLGAAIWIFLFAYGFVTAFRIRKGSQLGSLSPEDQYFFRTFANALIASMVGFVVGGAFIAIALNDITWLTFSLITSLDLLYRKACKEAETAPLKEIEPQIEGEAVMAARGTVAETGW